MLRHAHHWLILHGRYVCVARKPKCPLCVVRDLCRFTDKTEPDALAESDLPLKPKTPPARGRATHRGN
jgi:adenine-specific DNA glycosylase